jgi:hypothetical protein
MKSKLQQNPEIASVSGFFIFTPRQSKAKKGNKNRFLGANAGQLDHIWAVRWL